MKKELKIAVRGIVQHVLRSGDLVSEFVGTRRLVRGILGHQKIQNSRPDNYFSEVPVAHTIEAGEFVLTVTGRIDGIYKKTSKEVVVDEIKTTNRDPETFGDSENLIHWAQAKMYAYMYAAKHSLDEIHVQLTYLHLKTDKIKEFKQKYTTDELKIFFHSITARYVAWAKPLVEWSVVRDASINDLKFPFPDYRAGQRAMAVHVYRAIQNSNQLIVQAPTGIGKTVATIFPGVKAIANRLTSKIFYLTARTTGRTAAQKALNELRKQGLKFKSLTLTAKEKICPNARLACNPDECRFAKGHFDRINQSLTQALSVDALTREVVEEIALAHQVCAFEFSLDLINLADCVICDYNYAFDPRVYLRRCFGETAGDYTFMIDEAHNLVDRSRDMFSSEIRRHMFADIKTAVKDKLPDIYNCVGMIDAWMAKAYEDCKPSEGIKSEPDPPEQLCSLLRKFLQAAEKWLSLNLRTDFRESLLHLYFEVSNFVRVSEQFDNTYSTCFENIGKDIRLNLFCMDPSGQMTEALNRCKAALFFSATMTPLNYFKKIFGCSDSAEKLILPSPFPSENLGLFVCHKASTLYNQRRKTAPQVTKTIQAFIRQKQGNYLLFFPSYKYMTMIREAFCSDNPDTDIIVQKPDMSESERDEFLKKFSFENKKTLAGFAVMGGIFGEGIDLVGDRLTGAVIVSVGLPGISVERELIRKYFAKTINAGFEFAYLYPGINRVLQAGGRVIRSEKDQGAVLLIDHRFFTSRYRSLFPREWEPKWIHNISVFEKDLRLFWNGKVIQKKKE